jgi:hypothetical protein
MASIKRGGLGILPIGSVGIIMSALLVVGGRPQLSRSDNTDQGMEK